MKRNTIKIITLIAILMIVFSFRLCAQVQAGNIFSVKLEHHLISRGDNRPNFNPYKDSIDYFLYAIHNGITEKEFAVKAGWSDEKLQQKIDLLLTAGFLKKSKGGKLIPNAMVVTQNDGKVIYKISEKVATEIADSLAVYLPKIKASYTAISFSDKFNFDQLSFFLISDVLLDNWQINNVESQFVKAPRTLRHGKNYYYQIAELDPKSDKEVFGIYGNQVQCNDTICAAVYGNKRVGIQLKNYYNDVTAPYILPKDEEVFKQMALEFLPSMLSIFERNRTFFLRVYNQSKYKDGISFEEYFMWWYHFIYTRATDICAERKLIRIPDSGNFFYRGK